MSSYLVITILIINAIVATISQVLLKISATKEYKNIYFEYLNPYVIFGYMLMFITIVVNIFALKYVSIVVSGVFSEIVHMIFGLFAGRLVFKEQISNRKIIGILIIVVGIIFVIKQ